MRKALLFLLILPVLVFGQQKFQISGVQVLKSGNPLQNPWVGGLNNPVFSKIDLNQDGLMDLFVYDKAAWKALAFLNTGSAGHPSFTYAFQYDLTFPEELRDWAVIRDYNHDGVGDIFALTSNSDIMVFKGYRNGSNLSYTKIYEKLNYKYGSNGTDHIWTFSDNLPVMMDIDHDGDLDILASDIGGGTTLNFYQNQAVENGMSPDSLVFIDASGCWGHFIENSNDCGVTLAYCKTGAPGPQQGGGGARHQGGAVEGFYYRPSTHLVSLLLADIYCNTLKFLENTGDTTDAVITYADSIFPRYDRPVNLPLFPAAFSLDADNDGYDDLLISPFASNAYQPGQAEDIKVVQYYHNIGIDSIQKFHYLGDSMLTSGIVDVGTESHPVFFDYNGDGLMDIVIGNYGQFQTSGASKSSLSLYQNTGVDTMPKYELVTTDWSSLSAFNINGLYPAFGDMNGDGKIDMVVGDYTGHVSYFKNTSSTATVSYSSMTQQNWFNLGVGQNAAPFIYDVNGDGLPDLVIGSRGNNIQYYWNFGTVSTPLFSRDSVNAFFGGIKVYDYHIGTVPGYATPVIARENNALVLYSGSQRGMTFKYAIDPDSLRKGAFQLLDSNVLGSNPGLRSTVSIADINHDGHNDYLSGNIRGGMTLFSDVHWGPGPINAVNDPAPLDQMGMEVFPNPAKDKIICRLTDDHSRLTEVHLYNMLGAMVSVPVSGDGAQMLTLSVGDVAAGVYMLQAANDRGQIFKHKVIILK
ncbi:MAG: repeat protein [Bacteroidetes bacterium]|nr:repeat protein [Bacteroidota bacterium]